MKIKLFILFLPFIVLAKDDLKQQSATNKEFISHLEQGKFEIVHPFQLRDKNERIGIDTRNYFLNADVHYQHVTFVIKSSTLIGGKLKLFLNLNDYLFFNDTKFTKLDGSGETLFNEKVENCYYQGTVNGDDTTFVALSTCNGLRGVIAFENGTTFGLWPLDGGDRNRRNRPPHVLFRTSWKEGFSCGAITENFGAHGFRRKRDISRQTKYVELAVLADNKLMTEFGFNDSKIIQYLLEAVNIADFMIARDLNVRLSIVYVEFWKDAQRVDLQEDIGRTLNGVNEYISGHIYPIVKDASIMLTTGSFVGQDAVSSMFSSICTARAVGLVKAIESNTVHQTAQLISHAIGHIIGLDHDSSDCLCPHQQKCIMNRQQSIIGSAFIWQFSKCSLARMQNVLESGHVQCLLNKPFQESRLHQCGNGVVDGDEECDCGPRSECFDPCCDPLTCTLRVHAQCASHQPCCHRCELRKAGTICRESKSICDVPEFCDGESGDCPPDGHLVDGIQCGINGNCWKGNCSDIEQQCKVLWGADAKAGEDACYNYNEKGLEYGNCGKNRNGEFKKCEKLNIKCGTLHCRDGSAMPINSKLNSFNFQFLNEGHHVQCKAITSPAFGLVPDGTSCGSGSICIDGTCLPLVQVSPPVHCPSNNLALQCSGHGDCTTTQKCICYDGWAGVACDTRLNTSRRLVVTTQFPRESILSGLNGRTIETTTLLMILLSVGVFLLLLLVCLLFFYRRRSSADYNAPTIIDKMDETFQDDGRAIKFGNMPSYRDEKRKLKKNKEVYNALHKINEVDERETVSLKSRESASIASVPHASEALLLTDGRDGGLLHNVRINRLYDSNPGGIYAESSVMPSPRSNRGTNSPAQSDFLIYRRKHHVQLDLNTGMDPDVNDILTLGSGGLRNGHSISSNLSSRAGSTNLKLSSLQEMMKHIPSSYARNDEDDICSDPELRHVIDQFDKPDPIPLGDSRFVMETNDYMVDPPPASADSGHPASVYEPSRHSPTLFSDKFKLDIEPRTT